MFTHLHTHTEYSLLDGIGRIPNLVERTSELGMDAASITDHGSLYGVVDFYSECQDKNIKPIIGCEMYVARNSRFDKTPQDRASNHLVLLAQNNQGYHNLLQLVTKSHLEGFHYRPRIDKELLEQYSNGIICLSGCASSEVSELLKANNYRQALETVQWYRDIFKDNYFLELQQHNNVPGLNEINQGLRKINRETNIPLIITNDAHYVRQQEYQYQDTYICIQTGTNQQDNTRLQMEDNSYYIKSPDEMSKLFPDLPQAFSMTGEVAESCNVKLDFDKMHLPKYNTPNGLDANQYLEQLCWEGFAKKYSMNNTAAVQRMQYELEVVRHTQFANYFLVVWDIISFVRRQNIIFGVRGSASASIILYCLDITHLEPLQHKLVFERFLNFERKEMPDIDMDFQDNRRDEILHYVIDKYGQDHVAQIITFITMAAKTSIRDTGRAMAMPYGDVDRVAKMISFKDATIKDALQSNNNLSNLYKTDTQIKELIDTASGLEGIVHHVGTHAAGVLISDSPLTDIVPLQRPVRGDEDSAVMMTQYSMDPVAKLGLLKMDFLGLTNLTILSKTSQLLKNNHGIDMNIYDIPLDDLDVYKFISTGNTTDIFQLESSGMKQCVQQLQPSTFGDIAALIALYRPGPIENIDKFIRSKHGKERVTYPHESMQDMLDETYGVIVYQDQVLHILQNFAGYSLGEADIVRKAMGKKIPSLMKAERDKFIDGANQQGYDRRLSNIIFDHIEPFAGYAFNKAHSVSYALLTYWSAYLKYYYPLEYMASVLTCRQNSADRYLASINECIRMGIDIALPDINISEHGFTIDQENNSIRIGLMAVKTLGDIGVSSIIDARLKNGKFQTIDDFCSNVSSNGLNSRTIESLIKAGCFDSIYANRQSLLLKADTMWRTMQSETKRRSSGQFSLFAGNSENDQSNGKSLVRHTWMDLPVTEDFSDSEKGDMEKEYLGVALSYNPILKLATLKKEKYVIHSIEEFENINENTEVTVVGYVSGIRNKTTREKKRFKQIDLMILGDTLDVMVWPDKLEKLENEFALNSIVKIKGRFNIRGDKNTIHCESVQLYQENIIDEVSILDSTQQQNLNNELLIIMNETDDENHDLYTLRQAINIILKYPGDNDLVMQINHIDNSSTFMHFAHMRIDNSEVLQSQLKNILGDQMVRESYSA